MDTKLQSFLDKVKNTASRTGRSVGRAADAAGKKASEMAAATRLNLHIFDLNTECDVLFRDFGRMVYELHRGDEVTSELASMRSVSICPKCGRTCSREDSFCPGCGTEL